MRIAIGLVALGAAVWATAYLTAEDRRNRLVWDHFDVVRPGILYRSGQLDGDQIEDVVAKYKIRTIVNFQVPPAGGDHERELARALGVDYLDLPMPGDGFGREDQFRQVLEACDDPARRPVLVHCARGTCRTGAAVAMYRFERDGWTLEDVAAEMRRQTYRDGWLPAYVYAMTDGRPADQLNYPDIRDGNLPAAEEATDAEAP